MKINNKKMVVLLMLSIVIITSISIAFMFKKSKPIVNQFVPAKVSCEVREMMNGSEKVSIRIKNTGDIDAYLRVHLVSYWVDERNVIVGKPSVMPTVDYDSTKWLKKDDTYYYKMSVSPNELTSELLKNSIQLQVDSLEDKTIYQIVEVFAEAIQSEPEKAVTESWKVTLTNGNISE